jgi:hypothetical protein
MQRTAYNAAMHPETETIAFTTSLVLTILLILGSAGCCIVLLAVPGLMDPLRSLTGNPWWFQYRDPVAASSPNALWRLGSATIGACIACVAVFYAHRLYRKNPSPLLPFIMVFLFSLALECLRAGTAILYAVDGSIPLSVVLTRTIYWGRFVGLLGLLVAGLYCIELKYRKLTVLAGAVFLVAFSMVAYIPMDRTVFLAQLTWKLGDEQGVWFVNLVIGILVVATSCMAAFTRRDRRFFWLSAGFALLLAAREFLFFATHPVLLAVGLVLLTGGGLLCLQTLSVIYHQVGEKSGV